MTPAEAQLVLAEAAKFDHRKVDETGDTARAWARALHGLPVADCMAAVAIHKGQSSEYLEPHHIRRIVKPIRDARIKAKPTPPPGLSPAEERRWIAAEVAAIGDGRVPPPALSRRPAGPTEAYKRAREARKEIPDE